MRIFSATIGLILLATTAVEAAEVSISLKNTTAKGPQEPKFSLHKIADGRLSLESPDFVADSDGETVVNVDPGSYIVASRSFFVDGTLEDGFVAEFYPGLSYFEVSDQSVRVEIDNAIMTLRGCKIEQTDLFVPGYARFESVARERGYRFAEGNAGRIINLTGREDQNCLLDTIFPRNSKGVAALHTYTPTAMEIYGLSTLEIGAYSYNGRTHNLHDVIMLDTSIRDSAERRIIVSNVLEKSGVNVPWEPRFYSDSKDCRVTVASRISFRSNENTPPATLVFDYLYLDDAFVPFDKEALMFGACE